MTLSVQKTVASSANRSTGTQASGIEPSSRQPRRHSNAGLSMLSKLDEPRYPIKNQFAFEQLGMTSFGSRKSIRVIENAGARNKTRDLARSDKAKTDAFFSKIVGTPGLSFSPRQMNALINEITARKPQSLEEILQMGFLAHVKDADQFCKDIQNPGLWDQMSWKGANISMPQFAWGDFKKIVQLIEIARAENIDNERKDLLYQLFAGNQLEPTKSTADQYYVENTGQLPQDTHKVSTSSASGQNVQRYKGGVHQNNRDGEFWLKTSGVQAHVVLENFSLHTAKALGLPTTNPELVRVVQKDGNSVLAIKMDYAPEVSTVVPTELQTTYHLKTEEAKKSVEAAAKRKIQDFATKDENTLVTCALNVAHMILFKDMDAIGRNMGNLHTRNGELVVLDRGSGMMYRGLGDLKGSDLEKEFSADVKPDLKFFVGDPDSPFSNLVFSGAIRTRVTQNPELVNTVIQHVANALGKVSGRFSQIAENAHVDDALKAYVVPTLEARAASLTRHLPAVFSEAKTS
jgi:hypothetical protein